MISGNIANTAIFSFSTRLIIASTNCQKKTKYICSMFNNFTGKKSAADDAQQNRLCQCQGWNWIIFVISNAKLILYNFEKKYLWHPRIFGMYCFQDQKKIKFLICIIITSYLGSTVNPTWFKWHTKKPCEVSERVVFQVMHML